MIMQAKRLFGSAAALLVVGTTFVMWHVVGELYSQRIAALEATIKTKESLIEFQQAKISALSDKKIDGQQVAGVSRVELVPLRQRLDGSPPGFDIGFRNTGSAPATRPLKIWVGRISDKELSEAEIDTVYEQLYREAKGYQVPEAANEMWPGKESWLTFQVNDGSKDAGKVVGGGAIMYMFVLLVYADADAPSATRKYTEGCYFTFRGQAIHECAKHNRLLLAGRR